ncbi:MAG: TldD/PmbA family protein [Candidatus Krumholzibacteria bacterium]|nr:TldD/PmbA family protein [Candidatus Krumholzibacteria bacterium]
MDGEDLKPLACETVERALAAGARTAEVSVVRETEFSVLVREGRIESLVESGSRRIGIGLSVDKRTSHVTSTDLSGESIGRLVRDGVELARIMDRDEYAGLPEPEELGSAGADLGIYDERTASLTARERIDAAMDLERTALGLDRRIISDGASCSTSILARAFANSLGFCEAYRSSGSSLVVSLAAEDRPASGENTGKKKSSWWYSTAVSFDGLDPVEAVAGRAVERTLRKLGAIRPRTCEAPVVFDPVTARDFVRWIAAAAGGGSIYRKSSFLVDMLGKRVGSPLVTIVDDPLLPGRPGSRPFDREGVRPRRTEVVTGGVLESYLLSSYQARKLSLATTGHAGGPSNIHLEAGESDPGDIIASVGEGLYLTSLSGPGANWSTGDFSQGAQGIWIRGGRLAEAVDGFTVTGTFPRMLAGIVMVGSDLEWRGAVNAPTFKVDSMTISGT